MSFGGSVAAMITSLKNNRVKLRDPQRTDHLARREGIKFGKPLKFKGKMHPEELELLRQKLTRKRNRQKRVTFISYSILFLATILGIIFYF